MSLLMLKSMMVIQIITGINIKILLMMYRVMVRQSSLAPRL